MIKLYCRKYSLNNMFIVSIKFVDISLKVEVGNPNVVWSASEDGTLRQHDFREGTSCPPDGASHQDCHNVLVSIVFSRIFCFFYSMNE